MSWSPRKERREQSLEPWEEELLGMRWGYIPALSWVPTWWEGSWCPDPELVRKRHRAMPSQTLCPQKSSQAKGRGYG